jgi:hypothetical protein
VNLGRRSRRPRSSRKWRRRGRRLRPKPERAAQLPRATGPDHAAPCRRFVVPPRPPTHPRCRVLAEAPSHSGAMHRVAPRVSRTLAAKARVVLWDHRRLAHLRGLGVEWWAGRPSVLFLGRQFRRERHPRQTSRRSTARRRLGRTLAPAICRGLTREVRRGSLRSTVTGHLGFWVGFLARSHTPW